MPSGPDRAYERNWAGILEHHDHKRCRALAILRWTLYAMRPLTVREITDALLVAVDDNDCDELPLDDLPDALDQDYVNDGIVDLCRALVEVRRASSASAAPDASINAVDCGNDVVQLVHFSVWEFLLAATPPRLSAAIDLVPLNDAKVHNRHLAKACIRYLQSATVWQGDAENDSARPSPDYGAMPWQKHVAAGDTSYSNLQELVNKFFRLGNRRCIAWRDHRYGLSQESLEAPTVIPSSPGPLYYAAEFGLVGTIEFLHAVEALDVDEVCGYWGTALQAASAAGHLEAVRLLLKAGARMDVQAGHAGSAVNAAALGCHTDVVRHLISEGADVNLVEAEERSALALACRNENTDIVRMLLDKGSAISATNKHGVTPLHVVTFAGHDGVVNLLLKHGAGASVVAVDGSTALHLAARKGHTVLATLLLDRGADLSVTGKDGWTALHAAAWFGHTEVARLLFERGADPSVATNNGWTTLHMAANEGYAEFATFLLKFGADLSKSDVDGWTVLHVAARHGHAEVATLLLDHGANSAAAANDGLTALHLAADHGQTKVATLLLSRGADPLVATEDGWVGCTLLPEMAILKSLSYL